MFDTNLLDILCCPETRGSLKMVDAVMLSALNQAIAAGSLTNVAGEKITEPFEEALVTEDGSRIYPIREGIPVLLADEGVLLPLGA
ncbi:MAG: hypothetical protein HUK21_02350 [Fibrobacteraceae bacterium]|nr:hypothetical protein [Fibrobacteraceae bacterium]